MKNIVGIRFKKPGKIYFFDPGNLKINVRDHVIVDTTNGEEYAEVAIANRLIPEEKLVAPLRKVIRIATPKDENEPIIIGRLIFRDSILSNAKELEQLGAENYTEIKFENTIDRFTAVAKPRRIERVIRGSKFNFEIIYDVGNEKEVEEDIQLVKTGFKLLENDYLGGSGSRGYGKVKFENLSIKPVLGDYDVKELNAILEG